jgi:ADP-ribose pyrophosphatase
MLEPFRHFANCPKCGAPGSGAASLNPFRCAACGFVLYFNAASAVAAFIVRDADGFVLYTRREKDPGKGRLGMPGGFVDYGETAEEAVRREVLEEVGLTLVSLEYLSSHPNQYTFAEVTYNTLDLFFIARTVAAHRAQALDAVQSIHWADPALVEPNEIAFESMRRGRADFLARNRR